MVLQPGKDLLLVSNAGCSLCIVDKGLVLQFLTCIARMSDSNTYPDRTVEGIPPREPNVDGIAKALPFLISEQVAEHAVAVCHCLIRAQGLSIVDIINSPLEALCHRLEAVDSYYKSAR